MFSVAWTTKQKAAWEEHVDPRLAKFQAADPQGDDRTRWFYQLYMKDYLRCVESVDESVGKLLKYLDDSGLAKNTIVVYTSDQGFYLGEHGWFDKRFMYEESLRTPLVVRWPGVVKPGSVETSRSFRTSISRRRSCRRPGRVCRRKFRAGAWCRCCAASQPGDWRKSFYYHFYEDKDADHHVAKHEGVTNGRAKLIHFYTLDEWELYDLEKDPHELVNVYGKPEYAKTQAKTAGAASCELRCCERELQELTE